MGMRDNYVVTKSDRFGTRVSSHTKTNISANKSYLFRNSCNVYCFSKNFKSLPLLKCMSAKVF